MIIGICRKFKQVISWHLSASVMNVFVTRDTRLGLYSVNDVVFQIGGALVYSETRSFHDLFTLITQCSSRNGNILLKHTVAIYAYEIRRMIHIRSWETDTWEISGRWRIPMIERCHHERTNIILVSR